MANDLRFRGRAFAAVLLVAVLTLLALPHGVWAKDGGSSDSGSDHSGSDHSSSDDSDSGGHSGKGSGDDDDNDNDRDDNGGSDDSARGSGDKDAQERRHTYDGGWLAQIRNGRYQVFDPAGRLVINREARTADYQKF
ncbi:hypothetical protein HGO38_18640 [Rhizobium sp. CG5]|uniref:hypothetical protein n=1 Tax=Rhizobium sp. CG5 TaxID=2726076 RepID=UPI0020334DEC|nr:hypothetical protein [Rhizobium sp. CG5]MCM2475503.1 hypothetical protein [Rhizobium sp. CG5]